MPPHTIMPACGTRWQAAAHVLQRELTARVGRWGLWHVPGASIGNPAPHTQSVATKRNQEKQGHSPCPRQQASMRRGPRHAPGDAGQGHPSTCSACKLNGLAVAKPASGCAGGEGAVARGCLSAGIAAAAELWRKPVQVRGQLGWIIGQNRSQAGQCSIARVAVDAGCTALEARVSQLSAGAGGPFCDAPAPHHVCAYAA